LAQRAGADEEVKIMATNNGNKPQLIEVVEEAPRMASGPRQLLRVSLGMLGVGKARLDEANERMEALFDEFVERGEALEKDGRRLLDEMLSRRRHEAERRQEEAEARLDRVLARLNVPTRKEIHALNEELAELNRKVDALRKAAAS
jgi:polyhydroxyalkanoate synthesis regulator phasin